MRLLKFRIWDKESNSFIEPSWHEITLNELFDSGTGCGYVFQMYTGLKDKNGIEIYEGDVIEYCISEPETATVTFEHGVFWGNYPLYEVVEEKYFCKVIGNIFEGVEK